MVVNTVSCSLHLTSSHATGSPALPAPCHVFLCHVHEPAAFTQRGCSSNTKWWFSPILHLQVHPSDPAPVCAIQRLEVWNSPSPHGHQPCPTGPVLHHPLGSGLYPDGPVAVLLAMEQETGGLESPSLPGLAWAAVLPVGQRLGADLLHMSRCKS